MTYNQKGAHNFENSPFVIRAVGSRVQVIRKIGPERPFRVVPASDSSLGMQYL